MSIDVERLSTERGDPDPQRLAAGGEETRFRGWRLAAGRESPTAAGIEDQVHVYGTREGEIVVGLRVANVNTGPNGPVRDSDYRAVEVFDDLDAAFDWLDEHCPWTEAVDRARVELSAPADGADGRG